MIQISVVTLYFSPEYSRDFYQYSGDKGLVSKYPPANSSVNECQVDSFEEFRQWVSHNFAPLEIHHTKYAILVRYKSEYYETITVYTPKTSD